LYKHKRTLDLVVLEHARFFAQALAGTFICLPASEEYTPFWLHWAFVLEALEAWNIGSDESGKVTAASNPNRVGREIRLA
jgi:hypothetical protein